MNREREREKCGTKIILKYGGMHKKARRCCAGEGFSYTTDFRSRGFFRSRSFFIFTGLEVGFYVN